MENIEYTVDGNRLLIAIDISDNRLKSAPLSSTGKTRLVASSHGAQPISDKPQVKFSINVYMSKNGNGA